MTCEIERESKVFVQITEPLFALLLADNAKSDVISYFEDGTRITNRRHEMKTTKDTRNVLYLHSGITYPVRRTVSEEVTVDLFENYSGMPSKKCINRHIIHHEFAQTDVPWEDNTYTVNSALRISLDEETTPYGVAYFFNGEIEYSNEEYEHYALERVEGDDAASGEMLNDTDHKYLNMWASVLKYHENLLVTHIHDHYAEHLRPCVRPEPLDWMDVYNIKPAKVQFFNAYLQKHPYKWAFKWDGIKGKMICDYENKRAVVWPDIVALTVLLEFQDARILKLFDKYCCQVEILDQYIVVVDILAIKINGNIHVSETCRTVALLKHFHKKLKALCPDGATVMYGGSARKFCIQQFYSPPLRDVDDKMLFDGHILIQYNTVVRYKLPTVDIKCVKSLKHNKFEFLVGDKTTLTFTGNYTLKAIYEMSFDNQIMRHRLDRVSCSGQHEYENFLYLQKIYCNSVMLEQK